MNTETLRARLHGVREYAYLTAAFLVPVIITGPDFMVSPFQVPKVVLLRTLAAVIALATIGRPVAEVVAGLERALADPDPFVRYRAARALGSFGSAARPSIEVMSEVLRLGDDPQVRRTVADAIFAIGEPADRIAESLGRCLGDPEESVAERCGHLLEVHLDRHPDALPALFDLVDDPDRGQVVRSFLRRRTGVDLPNARTWRRWYER